MPPNYGDLYPLRFSQGKFTIFCFLRKRNKRVIEASHKKNVPYFSNTKCVFFDAILLKQAKLPPFWNPDSSRKNIRKIINSSGNAGGCFDVYGRESLT